MWTSYLLALALAAHPAWETTAAQAHAVARAIWPAALQRQLDPALLAAVVIHESRGRDIVSQTRDYGPFHPFWVKLEP